jgi:hypothetical protein
MASLRPGPVCVPPPPVRLAALISWGTVEPPDGLTPLPEVPPVTSRPNPVGLAVLFSFGSASARFSGDIVCRAFGVGEAPIEDWRTVDARTSMAAVPRAAGRCV